MLHGQVIICISSLSWDFLWQRHQELMARFAEQDNRVLFVEPIGIRMPKWEDRQRIVARLRNRQRAGGRGIRPVLPNMWAVDPLVNPFQQIDLVHQRNVNALTGQLQNALNEMGGGEPILWTFVPTLLARAVIARLPRKLLVYDCMDALTENPKGVFPTFAESKKTLSREADLVFVTSRTLLERQAALNPHTYYVPHGVDFEKFAHEPAAEPAALESIPHPRLLFFGGIDERIDLELLGQLAAHHPDWQLVLIGIVRTEIARLRKFPNVHILAQKKHDELPAYLHRADVLMMPYRLNAYSHYMNPAKLQECLATGKPTVVTALPCFEEFSNVLSVASSYTEFEQMVANGIAEPATAPAHAARQACAREYTWEKLFGEINARLEERLQ